MPAMRIAMVNSRGQHRTVRNEEAEAHFKDLGYERCEHQPPQPEDDAPVIVRGPIGQRTRKVKRRTLKHWLGKGYVEVGGKDQEVATARHDRDVADRTHHEAARRKTHRPESAATVKAKKRSAKQQAADARRLRLATLLGAVPERDEATKQVVGMVGPKAFNLDALEALLTEWDARALENVPVADRAEFLLELQKR